MAYFPTSLNYVYVFFTLEILLLTTDCGFKKVDRCFKTTKRSYYYVDTIVTDGLDFGVLFDKFDSIFVTDKRNPLRPLRLLIRIVDILVN